MTVCPWNTIDDFQRVDLNLIGFVAWIMNQVAIARLSRLRSLHHTSMHRLSRRNGLSTLAAVQLGGRSGRLALLVAFSSGSVEDRNDCKIKGMAPPAE